MRKTTGYFFDASNDGGLISQYCTGAPPAPVTVIDSGALNVTSLRQPSFSCVSGCASPPPAAILNSSAGIVIAAFEKTRVEAPALTAAIAPPLATSAGVPPASGTRYRLSVPWLVAVK